MAQTVSGSGNLFLDALREAEKHPGQVFSVHTPIPMNKPFTQPPVTIPSPVAAVKDKTTVKYALRSMVKGDYMLFTKIGARVYSDWVTTPQKASLFDNAAQALHALQQRTADSYGDVLTSLKLVKVTLTYYVSETVTDL